MLKSIIGRPRTASSSRVAKWGRAGRHLAPRPVFRRQHQLDQVRNRGTDRRQGFRVIMPDLRAHGLSAKPHDPANYPTGILARDLRELIARLELAEFDLGGFSLGARTTVEARRRGASPAARDARRRRPRRASQLEAAQGLLRRGDRAVRCGAARRSALAFDPVHEEPRVDRIASACFSRASRMRSWSG